jgi:hypothetical protein
MFGTYRVESDTRRCTCDACRIFGAPLAAVASLQTGSIFDTGVRVRLRGSLPSTNANLCGICIRSPGAQRHSCTVAL